MHSFFPAFYVEAKLCAARLVYPAQKIERLVRTSGKPVEVRCRADELDTDDEMSESSAVDDASRLAFIERMPHTQEALSEQEVHAAASHAALAAAETTLREIHAARGSGDSGGPGGFELLPGWGPGGAGGELKHQVPIEHWGPHWCI